MKRIILFTLSLLTFLTTSATAASKTEYSLKNDFLGNLSKAIASIGEEREANLIIDTPSTLWTDTTITANLNLIFRKGAIITINKTLTLNANIQASNYRIFSCINIDTPCIIPTDNKKITTVNPAWWGFREGNPDDPKLPQNHHKLNAYALKWASEFQRDIELPPGEYWLPHPVELNINSVKISGRNTILNGRKSIGVVDGSIGSYGLLKITGDNNKIQNIRFTTRADGKAGSDSRILVIKGNNNHILHNTFYGGNGGAIRVFGNRNLIANNKLNYCNNTGENNKGHYGSIHIRNGGKNIIRENEITNFKDSGISVQGPVNAETINAEEGEATWGTIIKSNYILGNEGGSGYSAEMGIFVLDGAGSDMMISGNTIKNMRSEGIVINYHPSLPVSDITITNNIIENCQFASIAFGKLSQDVNASRAVINNNIISNFNALYSSSGFHGIWLQNLTNSQISGNILNGAGKDIYDNGHEAINLRSTTNGDTGLNVITSNTITNWNIGIIAHGKQSIFSSNIVNNCHTGITYNSNVASSVIGNIVSNNDKDFNYSTATDPLTYNTFTALNNLQGNSNQITPVRQFYSNKTFKDPSGTLGTTRHWYKSSLNGSTKTLTFYHIQEDDVFNVEPVASSSGDFRIISINPSTNKITVEGTVDDQEFVLYRVSNK